MKVEFHTFDEMISVLSHNTPQALVLDSWLRLEKAIKECSHNHGFKENTPVSRLINEALKQYPEAGSDRIAEIHKLRKFRNRIAHGNDVVHSAQQADDYARKAWKLSWLISEVCETSCRLKMNNET